jgi:transcriptional regulator of acetoin/glycerol metabolism
MAQTICKKSVTQETSTAAPTLRETKTGGHCRAMKCARYTSEKVLQMCNGNHLRAAQILGIGRTSLYCYLKRDGYDVRPHTNGVAA